VNKSVKLTPEMIDRLRAASAKGQRISMNDVTRAPAGPGQGGDRERRPGEGPARPGGPPKPGGPPRPVGTGGGEAEADEDEKKKSGVIGRDSRHKGRQDKGRQTGPRVDRGSVVIGKEGVETIEEQFGSRRGPRQALLNKMRRREEQKKIVKEGKIEIVLPITVRSLSEAIGMKAGEVSKRLLKETNQLYGNNSPLDFALAEAIAIEKNIELVIKRQKTAEDILLEEFERRGREVDPEKLRPRPPIVTIMGHVDHGKTSLLDKIRRSNIAAGEVGGITQVIRAWSVTHKVTNPDDPDEVLIEKQITFLDTPGHEAFTKMRARGANVTDIAIIVVAATDGVMPQTEEAIAHARAAGVRIIVAINKVDAPNANIERTRRQLYQQELLPDTMGGDIQFVETSAVTGQGIDDLLTAISLEAELNIADKLQADPDRPANGTCLEAYMTSDEGVMATVLVQQGTLHVGDIILCGATFGRVRSMNNDLGQPVEEAGPSTPVRITGLGDVPNADDPFYVVDELATAKEIAEARAKKDREDKLVRIGVVKDLDSFSAAKSKQKITELKVILKAEARGSVEAIRKELEKLTHEEVTTRVLHAGIGAISEADVTLALTSPDDTLIVGFNVTADDAALKLAEERGISLNEYQIIYNLVDDVKAALEGRLKPIEEVVHLGRASVRQTFKVGKVGTIAGCYVTSGVLERSARVRVIRGGVVIFPQGEKVVGLDSLKRFKDDAREVREGFECGLKITGFDDIKVDDVIEAFKIEIKHRTL
jgi:translation initiation factor IF-2